MGSLGENRGHRPPECAAMMGSSALHAQAVFLPHTKLDGPAGLERPTSQGAAKIRLRDVGTEHPASARSRVPMLVTAWPSAR